jgi:hypothetical protein
MNALRRAKPVRWVVPDFLPRKIVTTIAGKRDSGKSLVIAWLASATSRGQYPKGDGSVGSSEPLNVLINTLEDPIDEVLIPRLQVARADMDHVSMSDNQWLLPGSLGSVRDTLMKHREDGFPVDLLVLDSLQQHVRNPYHGFRLNRDAMNGLLALGRNLDMSIVLVHHFSKGKYATIESAIGGQGVLQNTSKAIYVFGPHPQPSSNTAVLACERIGVAEKPKSLLFEKRLKFCRGTGRPEPYFEYAGPIDAKAWDVYEVAKTEEKGSGRAGYEQAAEFCINYIVKNGPYVTTVDLEGAASQAGLYFSKGTFDRGRKLAGVKSLTDTQLRDYLGDEYLFLDTTDLRRQWVTLPPSAFEPPPVEDEEQIRVLGSG